MKSLVLANQKGGVGKSAIATQFAYYLAERGQRVLVVDLDHQKNATKPILKSGRAVAADFTASQMLMGEARPLPDASFVLVPGDEAVGALERQPAKHNDIANTFRAFLRTAAGAFDVCVIDTNPNPDIRYAIALIAADYVLSPIQLNQEAIDGIGGLLNHPRYGFRKIKAALNPALELVGILPNLVEATPFQRVNFAQLAGAFASLLIAADAGEGRFAFIPKRSAIAEAQAEGAYLADVKKTAARDAWRAIAPAFALIARRMHIEDRP